MASTLGHSIASLALGANKDNRYSNSLFLILTVLSANVADFDAIGLYFHVPYGSPYGHRGFTHSILFAFIWALIMLFCFRVAYSNKPGQKIKLFLYFFIISISHPWLDALTNGGLGVELFYPFSHKRFFFPWRPILVSPMGTGFFSERGIRVLVSELVWIGSPSLVLAAIAYIRKKI